MLRKNSVKILQKNNAKFRKFVIMQKFRKKKTGNYVKKHSNFVKKSVHFKDFSFNWLAQLTRFGWTDRN